MNKYVATPKQWADTEYWAGQDGYTQSCILELCARVEALEARHPVSKVYEINEPLRLTPEQAQQVKNLLTPNYKPEVRGPLLVTRVAAAISQDGEPIHWSGAYAAIREVAAWLREQHDGDPVAATALERELEQ
jgi:hypothetical protein